MKITLEASPILHTLTGIGRYTWELATRLSYHPEIDDVALYVRNEIVCDAEAVMKMGQEKKQYPLWSKPIRLTKRFLKRRHAYNRCHHSLVHGPNYFLPSCAESGIITVHDLSIYRYPQTHPLERIAQFEKNFDATLRRASHIITDSEAMRREIINFFGWSDERISVIGLGVAPEFKPRDFDNQFFLNRYGLIADGYTLCVSTIEPRKNIDKLLSAYRILPQNLRNRFPLVIIGGIGWHAEPIVEQIEVGVREGWVIRPGFVPEHDLLLFYSHARLFVYPSAYEGFGLPVVEAMASGVPVIISNRTSLPEVAQGAGIVIEPDDQTEFVMALQRGLDDEIWRAKAKSNGIEAARNYTWEKCVNETVNVYQKIDKQR
ncbi:MAG: glycosyltransferase family 1 protein [Campylobacterales bacterium]|nr:glycosyltransferase family 1 protein [Campylobacterales bacterium]